MATLNVKMLKEKVSKMLSAWFEGAKGVSFMGISRDDLAAKEILAESLENEINESRAITKMKEDELANVYLEMNNMTVNVRNGVGGDPNYGDDSVLYGAMGFVRKSERRSGLTRKKNPKTPTTS